jgi:uncharacterized membrane protein YqgA involved in biofilm formation
MATVLVGTGLGVALGHRIPDRTRSVVTDGLGLVTLLVAGEQASHVVRPALSDAVGSGAVLVVLGAILVGGLLGSLLRLDSRLTGMGDRLQRRYGGGDRVDATSRNRFVEGFVLSSLVFCVGPLTIIGSLADGLRGDISLLALKSTLDGFAALAFASALGWGVVGSVAVIAVFQGGLTALAWATGSALSDASIEVMTATGGVLLVGVALRLLRVKEIAVVDMLPALAVAPGLAGVVSAMR